MKKIFIYIFIFIFCLAGGVGLISFDDIIYVSSGEDLQFNEIEVNQENFISVMSASATYGNSNVKLIMQEDINLEGEDLSSLYSEVKVFKGIFDGNGYEISNITLQSTMSYFGLFPYAQNATIQNLRVTGKIDFVFDQSSTSPIYAGVLVGYGENISIKNCELYNVEIIENENGEDNETRVKEQIEHSINLSAYSNITFGGLVGMATSFTTSGQASQSIIENCVNYYDTNLELTKINRLAVGGIVGYLTNGSKVINCLNFGDITLTNNIVGLADDVFSQYLGGICGEINGTSTSIKNTAFGGGIVYTNEVDTINAYAGTIVGFLNCPQASSNYNVNFSYWTQGALQFYGYGYTINSDKLSQVSLINRAFLADNNNFDTIEKGFDFGKDWAMIDSKILLQNFQEYKYNFNGNHYDNGNIISNGKFTVDGRDYNEVSVKYGKTVKITITYADEYVGYYSLSSVLLNGNVLSENNYNMLATTDLSGVVNGYEIEIFASDTTDGTYTFSLYGNTYYCEIEISEDAYENNQGSIKSVGNGTSSTTFMNPGFTYLNRTLSVQAEGSDIYTFDSWEIYYKDGDGNFSVLGLLSDEIKSSAVISIVYGTAPFDKEFRLVAYFTDEDAVQITIGNFNESMIDSITLRGIKYEGQSISVPYNSTNVSLVVTTNKGYVMDIDSFINFIQRLYGENSTSGLVSEPFMNENGQTTYQFTLNMRYMQDSLTTNQLALSLNIEEDNSNNDNSLLWVYIVVPTVSVIIIIGIIIFVIIKRRGGGKGKTQIKKEKQKEENYRDYYI